MKKILSMLLIFLTLVLVACQTSESRLPDLVGKHIDEVENIIESLGYYAEIEFENTDDYEDMTFIRYRDYEVGKLLTEIEDRAIWVIIAINSEASIVLPDLEGKNKLEIEQRLNSLFIQHNFEYVLDDEKEADTFASYAQHNTGDSINATDVITVNLYDNSFLTNQTSLIISKYWDNGDSNQAIEIFNPTADTMDLTDYHIAVLSNGALTPTYTVNLTGMLEPNETYLIAHPRATRDVMLKADLRNDTLSFDGNDAIQLRYKNGTYIDMVAILGSSAHVMTQELYIRSEEIVRGSREYLNSQWDEYVPQYIDPLGMHPYEKPTTFSIDLTYVSRPFGDPLGGMAIPISFSGVDGDTTQFSPGFEGNNRLRYLGIDTPETNEPGGPEATIYTNSKLSEAQTIHLQSDQYLGHIDTYGRRLGYVWVDGQLLNYLIVLNGYSLNNLGTNTKLIFENRYIYRWFEDAEDYARANGLGVHGQW